MEGASQLETLQVQCGLYHKVFRPRWKRKLHGKKDSDAPKRLPFNSVLHLLISVGSGHRGLRDSLEEVELVVGRDKSCDYQVPDSGRPLVYAFGARVCGGPYFSSLGPGAFEDPGPKFLRGRLQGASGDELLSLRCSGLKA